MKQLPINPPKNNQISMTQELLRKSIHVFSLSIPILYLWNTRSTMIWIFLPLTILLLILEFVRYYNPKFQTLIKKIFWWNDA